jgi:two-component system LytT family response regulator
MIRALIADDEAPARDKLDRWLGEHADIEIVARIADGVAAADAIDKLKPDLAFLDIQMPLLNGLEVAAQLERDTAPLLVFVTAYDEHAVRAFDLNAIDYLLKPYDKDRLLRCLARVRERLAGAKRSSNAVPTARTQVGTSERLLVPDGDSLQLIDAAAIRWLEADDNYVHVHTATRKHLLRRTLADLLLQLGEQRFMRIHKSAAVNLSEIASLTPLFKGDYEMSLRGGGTLRLSRRFKDALFAKMGR